MESFLPKKQKEGMEEEVLVFRDNRQPSQLQNHTGGVYWGYKREGFTNILLQESSVFRHRISNFNSNF